MGSLIASKKQVAIAGLATLVGIGGIGFALMFFFHNNLIDKYLLVPLQELGKQFLIGSGYAIVTLIPLTFLLERKMFDNTRSFFADLIVKFNVNTFDIFFLSFCAGVGEELLFRGAIQPWIGIWPTAVIFIALHGYLNPKNRPLFIYGMVLLIVSAGFGYLLQFTGMYSSMAAHFWIDVALMLYLKRSISK